MTSIPRGSRARAASMLAAGAVAGGVLAATISASAAGSGTTGTSPTAAGYAGTTSDLNSAHRFGSTPVRSDEAAPSSAIVTMLTNKALAKVPGGTVYRVETDAGDGAYEAHMKKADGSLVTVKFDKKLNVIAVEAGMGMGDPGPSGRPPAGAPPTSG